MHKSDLVYIEHILDCIKKIKKFKTLLSDKKQGAPTLLKLLDFIHFINSSRLGVPLLFSYASLLFGR